MAGAASSSTMIGRDAEIGVLDRALADGRAGRPRAVVVRGEAGIGKTRLLREFRVRGEAGTRPGDPPLVVAVGQCVDLGPIGAPFTSIRRVVRDLHAAVGDEAFRAGARSSGVLATLRTLAPEVAEDAGGARDTSADYVAEAIETLIEGLSQTHHLLLIVEDLHWADASTMALLKTLAGTLRGRHVTMVVTYRSDDLDRFHPLRPVLAELERNRTVTGIEVRRLTPGEVVAQAVALGATAGELSGEDLAERSGGIPFLVEELVGLGDARLPDTLRELVLARYERLDDAARDVVRVMSAGGVSVSHEAVAAAADLPDEDLDHALREAIEARVIEADGTGYAFRHALTREAVHDDLLPSERTRFHRRYGEHYSALPGSAPGRHATIAEHWLAARDVPRAFDATVAALAEAEAGAALATAVKLAERLIELWPQVPDAAGRAGFDQQQLFIRAVMHICNVGEYDRMLRIIDEGLVVCPDDDSYSRAWLLRMKYVGTVNQRPATATDDVNLAMLEEAMRLIGDDQDPRRLALRARVLSLRGGFAAPGASPDAAWAREAITTAVASGDTEALVTCVGNLAVTFQFSGDDEAALALFSQVPYLPPGRVRTMHATSRVVTLMQLGRYEEAADAGISAYQEAVAHGVERGMGAELAANLTEVLVALGRPQEADAFADRALQLLTATYFRSFVLRTVAGARLWQDRRESFNEVRSTHLGLIESMGDDPEEMTGWALVGVDALLAGVEDAPDAAARTAAVQSAVDLAVRMLEDAGEAPFPARLGLISAARAAAAAARAGVAADRLRALIDRTLGVLGDAPRYRVLLAFVRAELDDADVREPAARVARWRGALAAIEPGVGISVVYHHLARLRLASALLAAGEKDAAAVELDRLRTEAPAHGAAIVARWAREAAERAGILGAEHSREGGAAASDVVSTLTPRELQVLELVARGLTNPQIGAELFISPKTASVHVSAILSKIGAANRTEAASLFAAESAR